MSYKFDDHVTNLTRSPTIAKAKEVASKLSKIQKGLQTRRMSTAFIGRRVEGEFGDPNLVNKEYSRAGYRRKQRSVFEASPKKPGGYVPDPYSQYDCYLNDDLDDEDDEDEKTMDVLRAQYVHARAKNMAIDQIISLHKQRIHRQKKFQADKDDLRKQAGFALPSVFPPFVPADYSELHKHFIEHIAQPDLNKGIVVGSMGSNSLDGRLQGPGYIQYVRSLAGEAELKRFAATFEIPDSATLATLLKERMMDSLCKALIEEYCSIIQY